MFIKCYIPSGIKFSFRGEILLRVQKSCAIFSLVLSHGRPLDLSSQRLLSSPLQVVDWAQC